VARKYLEFKILVLKRHGRTRANEGTGKMATVTMIVRHRVADYAAWRSVYETVEGLRQQHGCFGAEVMVDPGDKQEVFILHRFPTVEQAEAFGGSAELREAMGRAGVEGPPRIEIAVEA
jgi:quinol monooxygenase YgiN